MNTDCYNTDGSHECVCKIGFEGSPSKSLDIKLLYLSCLFSSILILQQVAAQTSMSVTTSTTLGSLAV